MRHYFGEPESLAQLVGWTDWLAGEGYRFIYEEARRQKPACSMALNWCYNDCWPCAANNSLVAYPAVRKPALDAVRDACRPACVSARIPKFEWASGQTMTCDLFILNDSPEAKAPSNVTVHLAVGDSVPPVEVASWDAGGVAPNENLTGPTVRFKLPDEVPASADSLWVCVTSTDPGIGDTRYRLLLRNRQR